MKTRMYIVLLALAVALTAVAASAQANTGTVKGKVLDEKGRPMVGATMRITTANGQKLETKVDENGQYTLAGVPAGPVKLELLVDEKPRTGGETTVIAGEVNEIDLDLAAFAAQQKMTPEERKKAEQEAQAKQQKALAERAKVKNLNAMLAQAEPMMNTGNYDGALALYKNAVQTDPTKALLWAKLGLAYLGKNVQTKDKDEATELANEAASALQKAVSLAPNVSAYHNNLGQAYARSGKTDVALKEFQTAAQMEPAAAVGYYFNAGATLTNQSTKLPPGSPEQKKALDEANEMFRKSATLDPKYREGEAYYQIATNLLNQATVAPDGKMVVPDGTADAYQKYLEEAPNGRYAESAKQTLAALGSTIETSYKKTGKKKK